MILSLAPDLLMRSKIDLAARHYGVEAIHVHDDATFRSALGAHRDALRLVLVDLDLPGVETIPLVEAARRESPATVVGFCSHVMTELIRSARDAGAHRVLPNSTFAAGIPGLVAPLAAIDSPAQENQ